MPERITKKIFPYARKMALTTIRKITTEIQIGDNKIQAEIIVIQGKGRPVLCRKAAIQLGVLITDHKHLAVYIFYQIRKD